MSTRGQLVQLVEVDVPRCLLAYGTTNAHGTCEAVLGETGEHKCFNTLATCQDVQNFTPETVTLRYAVPARFLDEGPGRRIEALQNIRAIAYTPAIVSLGENVGERSSLTVEFDDHRDEDTGPEGDPYVTERNWNPWERGTYWGRFRARQPFLRARDIRLIRGYLPEHIAEAYPIGTPLPAGVLIDQVTHHLKIDAFDGPTPQAAYSLIAKDILKALDGDRAQMPRPNNGFLQADIGAGAGSAVLLPFGIGDLEYEAAGFLTLAGKEIVEYTRSGDTVTFTQRGALGTEAQEHKAQDRVQTCLHFAGPNEEGIDPAELIRIAIEDYTDIPSSQVPIEAWLQETENFFQRLITATMPEPRAVRDVVSRIVHQCGLAIWGDDVAQEIRLRVIRAIPFDAASISEHDHVLTRGDETTLRTREQPGKRRSLSIVYYGLVNPCQSWEDENNYRSWSVGAAQVGDLVGSAAIEKIFANFIPQGARPTAERLHQLRTARFGIAPRHFEFDLTPEDAAPLPLGQGARLEWSQNQDATGLQRGAAIQIVSRRPDETRVHFQAEEMNVPVAVDLADRTIIIETNEFNVNLRSRYNQQYPAPIGGEEVRVFVNPNIIVGSQSTSEFSFEVGDWPGSDLPLFKSSASGEPAPAWDDTTSYALGQYIEHDGHLFASLRDDNLDVEPVPLDEEGESPTTGDWVQLVRIRMFLAGRFQGRGGDGGAGRRGGRGRHGGAAGGGDGLNGEAGETTDANGQDGGPAFRLRYPVELHVAATGQIWSGGGGGAGGGSGGGGGGGGGGPSGASGSTGSGGGGGGGGSGGGGGGGAGFPPGIGGTGRASASGGNPGSGTPAGQSGSSGGNSQAGQPGTTEAGGARGNRSSGGSGGGGGGSGSGIGNTGGEGRRGGHGGPGGDPGEPGGAAEAGVNGQGGITVNTFSGTGSNGSGGAGRAAGSPGAAGIAIDGLSFISWIDADGDPTSAHGDVRGPTTG